MGLPALKEQYTDNQVTESKIVGLPSPQEMMVYETWAKTASESQMYRNIGKEAAIMMIILSAREFGIGPAQALNGGLQIIEGKVELSAKIMGALIRRAGHKLKIEDGEDYCKITGIRKDTSEKHEVKYTVEMAQRAGLIKDKGAWKKHQEDMLYNRALSRLARRLFGDVIGMGYIQGEISDSRGVSVDSEAIEEDQLQLDYPSQFPPDYETTYDQLIKTFSPEDRSLAVRYISDVSKHYDWSTELTVKQLSEALKETMVNFMKYKQRFNNKVTHTIGHIESDDISNNETE